jgi:hypothetical protein
MAAGYELDSIELDDMPPSVDPKLKKVSRIPYLPLVIEENL